MAGTATLLARALDPSVEPPDDATSEQILDAALAVCAASGARHLTMDDVARKAGVGRMTVYRRFGERERLLDTLAIREMRRCLAQLDATRDPSLPVADQVADAFVTGMRVAREHPLLNRLATTEPESILAALAVDDGFVFTALRAFAAERLREATGDEHVEERAELLIRLCLSFVLFQPTALPIDDEDGARRIARDLIAPLAG